MASVWRVEYFDSADNADERFAQVRMHRVSAKVSMEQWPGIENG